MGGKSMTIEEALQAKGGLMHLSFEGRLLYWNSFEKCYIVRQPGLGLHKRGPILATFTDLSEALDVLVNTKSLTTDSDCDTIH